MRYISTVQKRINESLQLSSCPYSHKHSLNNSNQLIPGAVFVYCLCGSHTVLLSSLCLFFCAHEDKELHQMNCCVLSVFPQCFHSTPQSLMQVNVKDCSCFCPLSPSPLSLPPFSLSKNFHLNENPASVFCSAPRGGGVSLVRIPFEVNQCELASRLSPRPPVPR